MKYHTKTGKVKRKPNDIYENTEYWQEKAFMLEGEKRDLIEKIKVYWNEIIKLKTARSVK